MISRRALLRGLGALGVAACGHEPTCPPEGRPTGTERWRGATDRPFHTTWDTGLDARRLTDLSVVADAVTVIPNAHFFVRTGRPDGLAVPDADWVIAVSGLVESTAILPLAAVRDRALDQGEIVVECSGNSAAGDFGLLANARWVGAPLVPLLRDLVAAAPGATRVQVIGNDDHSQPSAGDHSTPGASWIFTWEELDEAGAFLATGMNGADLEPDHGHPVRLVVPGWYGCACIKWVERIVLVDEAAAATPQMLEFAGRTHQRGTPALARDFRPARMQLGALPVRVDRLRGQGDALRITGILWGGDGRSDDVWIRIGDREVPIDCLAPGAPGSWSVWTHTWTPRAPGVWTLACFVDDDVPQPRLDDGRYARRVRVG